MCKTSLCLQAKGYTVRGTVRSLADEEKVSHLVALGKALPGAFATVCCCLYVSTKSQA